MRIEIRWGFVVFFKCRTWTGRNKLDRKSLILCSVLTIFISEEDQIKLWNKFLWPLMFKHLYFIIKRRNRVDWGWRACPCTVTGLCVRQTRSAGTTSTSSQVHNIIVNYVVYRPRYITSESIMKYIVPSVSLHSQLH